MGAALDFHLDPLGGWAGDMFAAALLDAFPEHWPAVEAAIGSLDLGPTATSRLVPHRDRAGLTGRRFLVAAETDAAPATAHHHDHHRHGDRRHPDDDDHGPDDGHRPDDAHGHRRWPDIRTMLEGARLSGPARDHALAIFGLLAAAEAEVHGVAEDEVAFHEVGAVDSIVDIVAAGEILALLGPASWSSAPLPLGSGRVRTRHGLLPVPAPATALLLRGLETIDDGVPGERVTPTGAAIARHLLRSDAGPAPGPRRLVRSGTGFGSRELPGLSNCLRVLAFEPAAKAPRAPSGDYGHRELGVVTFEVDDLSAEDLALGLDRVRALPGIHDVIQSVAFGKKGRVATQVQVLVAPEALDAAIGACFTETTTIGLRYHLVRGAALRRVAEDADVEGRRMRVKRVDRPGGLVTAKAEAADVAGDPGHAARVALRHAAEQTALERARRAARPAQDGAP